MSNLSPANTKVNRLHIPFLYFTSEVLKCTFIVCPVINSALYITVSYLAYVSYAFSGNSPEISRKTVMK